MFQKLFFRGITVLLFVAMLASCTPAASPGASPVGGSGDPAMTSPGNVSDPGEVAMGRYIEEEIAVPVDIGADLSGMVKSFDGVLYSISRDGMTLYSSADGATWERRPTGLASLEGTGGGGGVVVIDNGDGPPADDPGDADAPADSDADVPVSPDDAPADDTPADEPTDTPSAPTPSGSVYDFTFDENGDLYILYIMFFEGATPPDGRLQSHLVRCSGGVATEIPFIVDVGAEYTDENGETYFEMFPDAVAVLSNGNILIASSNRGGFLFGPEGGEAIDRLAIESYSGFSQYGDELAFYQNMDRVVQIYDGLTLDLVREIPVEGESYEILLQYDSQGALHYASSAGVFRAVPGGTLWERIVDGNLCALSQPTLALGDLLFDAEEEPIVVAYNLGDGTMQFLGFHYDPSVPTEPEITLNLYALYDSEYLRQCIALFQKKFPEAMVKLDIALGQDSAVTRDDAIRTLNMEVLGGQGPDLLLLDGLPMESYVEKGVLADMSDFLEPLIADGSLLPNIAGTFRQENGLPAVPLRFAVPTLWGDEVQAVKTLEDLTAWAAARADLRPFFLMMPQVLIEDLYLTSAPTWYDERGLLGQDAIEGFLKAINDLYTPWKEDEGMPMLFQTNPEAARMVGEMAAEDWNPYTEGGLGGMNVGSGAMDFAYDELGLLPSVMRHVDGMMMPFGVTQQRGHGEFTLMPGQAQNVYLPSGVIGVNAKSANLDLAKEFVKLALSYELQQANTEDGFSVQTDALDAQMAKEESYSSFVISDAEGRRISGVFPDEAARQQMRALIDTLTTPVAPDVRIHDILVEESAPYFAGEIDLAQAAQNVVAKANAYLSE